MTQPDSVRLHIHDSKGGPYCAWPLANHCQRLVYTNSWLICSFGALPDLPRTCDQYYSELRVPHLQQLASMILWRSHSAPSPWQLIQPQACQFVIGQRWRIGKKLMKMLGYI